MLRAEGLPEGALQRAEAHVVEAVPARDHGRAELSNASATVVEEDGPGAVLPVKAQLRLLHARPCRRRSGVGCGARRETPRGHEGYCRPEAELIGFKLAAFQEWQDGW